MRHTEAETGRWTYWPASSEEDGIGDSHGFYDSKDEAVAAALSDTGPASAAKMRVGRVVLLTHADVAAFIVRESEDADECIRDQDEWGWRADPVVSYGSFTMGEMRKAVEDILVRRDLVERVWRVEDAEDVEDVAKTLASLRAQNANLHDQIGMLQQKLEARESELASLQKVVGWLRMRTQDPSKAGDSHARALTEVEVLRAKLADKDRTLQTLGSELAASYDFIRRSAPLISLPALRAAASGPPAEPLGRTPPEAP